MDSMVKYLGYALIIAGIAVIISAFGMGYSIYANAGQMASYYSTVAGAGGSSSQGNNNISSVANMISSSISGTANGIYSVIGSAAYMGIEITVLFLFASIGYKLTELGIKMIAGEREARKEPK